MATSLVISLRGHALEILQSIPEVQQNDYDRIVGALEIRYGHKSLRQVYQSQMKSRQQRSNEFLQEYEADIRCLIHLAYPQTPKKILKQIGIQAFIDELLDTEMQQALRLGRHTTIGDVQVAALEFKAAKEASRSYKSRFSPDRQPEQKSRSRSPNERNWREESRTPTTTQHRNSLFPSPERESRSRSPEARVDYQYSKPQAFCLICGRLARETDLVYRLQLSPRSKSKVVMIHPHGSSSRIHRLGLKTTQAYDRLNKNMFKMAGLLVIPYVGINCLILNEMRLFNL
ncbi:hypothetical protein NQ318_022698 [Aromia moschata]|uniref:Gag protein n=1 Tax=Aromia moschata TaxID=1265417 RepID=A0AAV8YDU5_9CUCU|nr:hypothetical protein NQ318_022698 [Aromia moschata]